jgi:hypothetical protein
MIYCGSGSGKVSVSVPVPVQDPDLISTVFQQKIFVKTKSCLFIAAALLPRELASNF